MPLQAQLDELTARIRSLVPPAKLEVVDQAVAGWISQRVADSALPVGATAPEFELPDSDGNLLRSAGLLAQGPLVVSFFRGRWCPYCVAELEAWRAALPQLTARGAALLAISPQTPNQASFMAEQHQPGFPILSDHGNALARRFGLVLELPPELRAHYKSVFVNLPFINGEPSWSLPIPATYLLSGSGQVLYRFVDPDYTRRADPAELLATLARNPQLTR